MSFMTRRCSDRGFLLRTCFTGFTSPCAAFLSCCFLGRGFGPPGASSASESKSPKPADCGLTFCCRLEFKFSLHSSRECTFCVVTMSLRWRIRPVSLDMRVTFIANYEYLEKKKQAPTSFPLVSFCQRTLPYKNILFNRKRHYTEPKTWHSIPFQAAWQNNQNPTQTTKTLPWLLLPGFSELAWPHELS